MSVMFSMVLMRLDATKPRRQVSGGDDAAQASESLRATAGLAVLQRGGSSPRRLLVKTSDKPIKEIAGDLGVTEQLWRDWVKRHEVDAGRRPGLSNDEREERKRRPRENRARGLDKALLRQGERSDPVAAFRFIAAGGPITMWR
jgi:transposase